MERHGRRIGLLKVGIDATLPAYRLNWIELTCEWQTIDIGLYDIRRAHMINQTTLVI